jgi:zinc protease
VTLAKVTANQVTHYTLKNGLQIFIKVDKRAPVVVSQIWYKVGSSYEPRGITGISHALEHMMFQGTTKYPPGKLMRIVAAHGGLQNAATSYDYTMYYQELPTKDLELSFKLESDRMINLLLLPKRFAKEIQVVREERRLRTDNDPQALTFEHFYTTANIIGGYHHPIIGWMHDLQHLNVNDLRKWYASHYAPNNAILVVAGDVQPQRVYQLARKYFGNIKAKKLPLIKPPSPTPLLSERAVTVNAPAKLPILFLGYNVPVIKTASQKWQPYALVIIANILAGGNSARLNKELIRKQQIAATASAWYDPFSRLANIFILYGIPAKKHTIQELKLAFLQQLKDLQTKPVSKQELNKVKTQLLAEKTFQQDSLTAQATEIGMLESVGLSWRVGTNFNIQIAKITPQQIQAAAQKFFITKRLTTGILKPQQL